MDTCNMRNLQKGWGPIEELAWLLITNRWYWQLLLRKTWNIAYNRRTNKQKNRKQPQQKKKQHKPIPAPRPVSSRCITSTSPSITNSVIHRIITCPCWSPTKRHANGLARFHSCAAANVHRSSTLPSGLLGHHLMASQLDKVESIPSSDSKVVGLPTIWSWYSWSGAYVRKLCIYRYICHENNLK